MENTSPVSNLTEKRTGAPASRWEARQPCEQPHICRFHVGFQLRSRRAAVRGLVREKTYRGDQLERQYPRHPEHGSLENVRQHAAACYRRRLLRQSPILRFAELKSFQT